MTVQKMAQNISTIMLPDQTHIEIVRGFSDFIKGQGTRNIFETKTAFIYQSGKPVTNRDDLTWLPEPYRTKAFQWYDTGEKEQDKRELDEMGMLKLRIAELEGKLMGKQAAEEKAKSVKPESKKVPPKKAKRTGFRCGICGEIFRTGFDVGKHRKTVHQATKPVEPATENRATL